MEEGTYHRIVPNLTCKWHTKTLGLWGCNCLASPDSPCNVNGEDTLCRSHSLICLRPSYECCNHPGDGQKGRKRHLLTKGVQGGGGLANTPVPASRGSASCRDCSPYVWDPCPTYHPSSHHNPTPYMLCILSTWGRACEKLEGGIWKLVAGTGHSEDGPHHLHDQWDCTGKAATVVWLNKQDPRVLLWAYQMEVHGV